MFEKTKKEAKEKKMESFMDFGNGQEKRTQDCLLRSFFFLSFLYDSINFCKREKVERTVEKE